MAINCYALVSFIILFSNSWRGGNLPGSPRAGGPTGPGRTTCSAKGLELLICQWLPWTQLVWKHILVSLTESEACWRMSGAGCRRAANSSSLLCGFRFPKARLRESWKNIWSWFFFFSPLNRVLITWMRPLDKSSFPFYLWFTCSDFMIVARWSLWKISSSAQSHLPQHNKTGSHCLLPQRCPRKPWQFIEIISCKVWKLF